MTHTDPTRPYPPKGVKKDQDGQTVHALTYHVPYPAPEGRPSRGYLELIRTAAQERGMPESYVAFLDRVEPRP